MKVERAGLIPYCLTANGLKMLFMYPSDTKYGGPYFQIAKGRIDEGEEPMTSAIREAEEELGIRSEYLTDLKYFGKILGRTSLYFAKYPEDGPLDKPCFETGEVKWMTVDEFASQGRPLHYPIVKEVVNRITDREF